MDYIQALSGSGGTRMIEGIKACLDYPATPERQRIVFFMTDGFIGNDDQILAAIKEKVGDTRLFSFGVGSSPNRSLLERMAQLGRSTAQYIRQDEPAQPVIKDMLSRISKPYLTDVEINWGSLAVFDVYPNPVPDLYSAQPLILFARYEGSGDSLVTLKGRINGEPYEESIRVFLPSWNPDNGSLALVWAREKIKYLMLERLGGRGRDIEQQVTNLALEYNLMSQYTSFVAVDEVIPEGSDTTLPRTIAVPVPMPEGVSFTGVFGPPSRYPGDMVAGKRAAGQAIDALGLSAPRPRFVGTPRSSRARSLSAALTPLRAPGRGATRLEEEAARTSFFYGRRYAALRADQKEGLALLPATEEAQEYLQEGFRSLHDKDKTLYQTLNRIYYAQRTDEKTANQTLEKLLSSKEEAEIALGLNLLAALAQQEIKIDEAFATKAAKLATEGKNEHIRSQALWAVCAVEKPVGLDILKKTARDEDAGVRMITAYALADKKLDKKAERLIARLVSDEDQRVAALAIKAGTDTRKTNSLIPAMSDILLNADSDKHYLAILEAGVGLGRLAEAEQEVRPRIQKIFVKALNKDYPTSVGEEKLNLKKAVSLVALKTLAGYKGQDVYPQVLKLATDGDKDVQTMAVSALAHYEKAASYLLDNVLAEESFLDRPELLANVVQHLRKYEPQDDVYLAVRRLLENEKVAGRSHGVLRVALVEALLDRGDSKDIQYAVSLLRKDSYWKVRRAILARLAGIKNKVVLDTALTALEDPHPVIKQLALAEAIAATAKRDKRAAYLDKLSQDPTPAICDEILVAEGLSSDLSVRPLKELRGIVAARTAELR